MPHQYSAIKNNLQKHPKVHSGQYLYNSGEPRGGDSSDIPAELEAELLENNHYMRRRFRDIAQYMRS